MSKKDSFWFRHDANSGRGMRMLKMKRIHGFWGVGVYWEVVEMLRMHDRYKHQADELSLQMLAELIHCDVPKFLTFFKDSVGLGLIQRNKTHFWVEALCENMKAWDSAKNAGIQSGKARSRNKKIPVITNPLPTDRPTDREPKTRVEENIKEESGNTHTSDSLKNEEQENKKSSGAQGQGDSQTLNSGAEQRSETTLFQKASPGHPKSHTGPNQSGDRTGVVVHYRRLADSPVQLEAFCMGARRLKLFPPTMEANECRKALLKIAEEFQEEFDRTSPGADFTKFGYRLNDHIKKLASDPERKPWEQPKITSLPYTLPVNPDA